jgi:hypothetical protein
MPTLPTIPIRRLTLYKHGVAFVEREGAYEGEALTLTFATDAVNDALKSLLVLDRQGGRVLGIAYDTPIPREERLAGSPFRLSDTHSLRDLLRALRGREVRLTSGEGSQSQEISGRLLGIDVPAKAREPAVGNVSLVDAATGLVTVLPLASLRQVQIVDSLAATALSALLDASQVEEYRQTLTIRLSPGAHDMRISYLIPSPTWRVSYRIVAETVPAAEAGAGGTLLLQGWGLIDNRLEEDLSEVGVTLVAGQPISFRYDLATSRIPERPLVDDAARIAPGPLEFAAAPMEPRRPPGQSAGHRAMMLRSPVAGKLEEGWGAAAGAYSVAEFADASAEPASTGAEQGELFAYQVVTPVTVRSGASALAPLLQTTLPYRRLLLFNREKLADHPVAALRFTNGSGLVLERGPVTVLEDGAYHGEAIVPFTKTDAEITLAIAVELGIAVTVETWTTSETTGIRIAGSLFHRQQASVQHTRYRVANSLPTAQVVTIEQRKQARADLVETLAPESQTAEHYRWATAVPARQTTPLSVSQRTFHWQEQQVLDQSYQQLAEYLDRRWLDRATMDRLQKLLQEHAAIGRNAAEQKRLQTERAEVYAREEQLRQNMAALGSGGAEGTFRGTVVDQLRACEERVNAIAARLMALEQDSAERQATIDRELATIHVDSTADTPAERRS